MSQNIFNQTSLKLKGIHQKKFTMLHSTRLLKRSILQEYLIALKSHPVWTPKSGIMWQFLLFMILLLQFVIICVNLILVSFLLIYHVPCNCHKSPFVNKDRGHILTGDLRIIKNNRLRRITCKVPKHCENKNINFSEGKKNIFYGLDQCICSWFNKKSILEESLSDGK